MSTIKKCIMLQNISNFWTFYSSKNPEKSITAWAPKQNVSFFAITGIVFIYIKQKSHFKYFTILLFYCIFYQINAVLRDFFLNVHFFMHLADAFIQNDLQCIQVIHFLSVCVFPVNWTHNLCAANAMLYHCTTGTHWRCFYRPYNF